MLPLGEKEHTVRSRFCQLSTFSRSELGPLESWLAACAWRMPPRQALLGAGVGHKKKEKAARVPQQALDAMGRSRRAQALWHRAPRR